MYLFCGETQIGGWRYSDGKYYSRYGPGQWGVGGSLPVNVPAPPAAEKPRKFTNVENKPVLEAPVVPSSKKKISSAPPTPEKPGPNSVIVLPTSASLPAGTVSVTEPEENPWEKFKASAWLGVPWYGWSIILVLLVLVLWQYGSAILAKLWAWLKGLFGRKIRFPQEADPVVLELLREIKELLKTTPPK